MPSLAKQGTPSTAPARAQSQSRTEQVAICFFKKQNYKVTATVGQRRALMRVITPVLNSGAGPNLIHLLCVVEPWRAVIKSARSPPLIDASNRSIMAIGEVKLHVWIGEFCARVPFLVVTNLVVDCILGTTFLDRHVKAILPLQRKVLFHHARSVALTGVTPSRHDRKMASRGPSEQLPQEENSADRKRAQFPTNVPSRKTRLFRGVTIPPITQAMVRVATPVGGLCFLQNHPKTAHKNLCLMIQGVMDLFPGDPFTVLFRNFGNRAVHVPKHTVVGLALPYPTHILTLGESPPGEAKAKEGGGNKNNSPTAAEEHARREQPAMNADGINSSTAGEFARRQRPATADGSRNARPLRK